VYNLLKNLEDSCVTRPNVSRTGLPAELRAESISIMNLNLNFGAKNKSEKWVRILARFFQVIVNYASAKFD
jgi:hypothetical protein